MSGLSSSPLQLIPFIPHDIATLCLAVVGIFDEPPGEPFVFDFIALDDNYNPILTRKSRTEDSPCLPFERSSSPQAKCNDGRFHVLWWVLELESKWSAHHFKSNVLKWTYIYLKDLVVKSQVNLQKFGYHDVQCWASWVPFQLVVWLIIIIWNFDGRSTNIELRQWKFKCDCHSGKDTGRANRNDKDGCCHSWSCDGDITWWDTSLFSSPSLTFWILVNHATA